MGIPQKPEKPGLSECCGGGSCCPCVWDVYFDQLQKWRDYQESLESQVQQIQQDRTEND